MLRETATSTVSFMIWVVTLPLFLLLRGRLDGAPPIVAGQGWDAVTSSTGEVVSYVSAVMIVMVAVWIVSAFLSPGVHTALRRGGYMSLTWPASFALSAASAVVVFLIFIALRGAPPGAAIPEIFD